MKAVTEDIAMEAEMEAAAAMTWYFGVRISR